MLQSISIDSAIRRVAGSQLQYIFCHYPQPKELPNHLTRLRLYLFPFLVVLTVIALHFHSGDWMFAAFLLLAFMAATDLVDGYVAREEGCTSDDGALWDPFADKLMVLPAMILLLSWTKSGFQDDPATWRRLMMLLGYLLTMEVMSILWYLFRLGGKSNGLGKMKLWFQVFSVGMGMLCAMSYMSNGSVLARSTVAWAMTPGLVAAAIFATFSILLKIKSR